MVVVDLQRQGISSTGMGPYSMFQSESALTVTQIVISAVNAELVSSIQLL